jgi:hypothetical protein
MWTAPIVLDGADQADAQLAGGTLIADNYVFFALSTLSENCVGLGSHTLTSPWGVVACDSGECICEGKAMSLG